MDLDLSKNVSLHPFFFVQNNFFMKIKMMFWLLLTFAAAGLSAQSLQYQIPVQRCEVKNSIVFTMLDSVKSVTGHCIFGSMGLPSHYRIWNSESTLCVEVDESGRLWNDFKESPYTSDFCLFYYDTIPVLVSQEVMNVPTFSSYFVPTSDTLELPTYQGATLLKQYWLSSIPYHALLKFYITDNGFTWELLQPCDCSAFVYEKVKREFTDEEFAGYFHCQRDSLLKNPQDSIRVGDDLMIEFCLSENDEVKAKRWTVLSTAPQRIKREQNCDRVPSKTVFKGEELRRMPLY